MRTAQTAPPTAIAPRSAVVRLAPADWVTLVRAMLAVGVAALVVASLRRPAPAGPLVTLAAVALVLDAVDGWVARRTRSGPLGARFDGETDAFLILVLSVYVARSAGPWVLAIGAMRYLFLLAGWARPWLRAQLPPRYWRKVVAATQGIVLTIAAARLLPAAADRVLLIGALALLTESFGRDVAWLWRHRLVTQAGPAAVADPPLRLVPSAPAGQGAPQAPVEPAGPIRGWVRAAIAVTLTVLALLVVWVALVAPYKPGELSLSAFLRVPLEGLVLIAVAAFLPRTPRRILAAVVGLLLALLVILKILDYGFFTTFNRPFDPLGDINYASIGIETLRDSVGRTEADVAVAGVVVGVIALLGLSTFSMFRLTAVAAGHRRLTLRAVGGLAAVWAICWAFGTQLLSHTPVASTAAANFLIGEVNTAKADLHDRGVFAAQIKHDGYQNIPSSQLLTSLRGKDVVLVFEEAYGQQAVQGTSFSPAIDQVVDAGTKKLQAAGFSARSGFLTSSTYGGISWLAHSTLQSGVWADDAQRYSQLLSTNRFTLSQAFKKAGYRVVDDVPSDDRPWPQGLAYYHYDKIYNRHDVGYKGPSYTYATMPDQYVFSALQRNELGKKNRPPLFAEVDTVSSHMPWNRIPEMVPWSQVGNGSIFNHTPEDHETGAFWSNPTRVKAAYGRSVQYSMNTLISFVQHYGKPNLVMIVLGDHQPLPIVSGHNSNHDVPISIISHDPKVLAQIKGWGWSAGLRPSPQAPVWPMDAFRNKFLNAFDAPAAQR